jgi:hypothetical protein
MDKQFRVCSSRTITITNGGMHDQPPPHRMQSTAIENVTTRLRALETMTATAVRDGLLKTTATIVDDQPPPHGEMTATATDVPHEKVTTRLRDLQSKDLTATDYDYDRECGVRDDQPNVGDQPPPRVG